MEIHPDDRVQAIITWPVITVAPHATLRDAAQLLHKENIGALVVMPEDGAPLGIVSVTSCGRWPKVPSPTRSGPVTS